MLVQHGAAVEAAPKGNSETVWDVHGQKKFGKLWIVMVSAPSCNRHCQSRTLFDPGNCYISYIVSIFFWSASFSRSLKIQIRSKPNVALAA